MVTDGGIGVYSLALDPQLYETLAFPPASLTADERGASQGAQTSKKSSDDPLVSSYRACPA